MKKSSDLKEFSLSSWAIDHSTVIYVIIALFFLVYNSVGQASGNYLSLENAYNSGEFEDCIKLLDKHSAELTTAKDSIAANTYFYVGDSHLALGDLDKALLNFEKELELREYLGNKGEISGSLYNLTYLEL